MPLVCWFVDEVIRCPVMFEPEDDLVYSWLLCMWLLLEVTCELLGRSRSLEGAV